MKKYQSVLFISCFLVLFFSSCSVANDIIITAPTNPVLEQEPVLAPQEEMDLKQQELDNDPNIITGFAVAGSCTFYEKSSNGENVCVEFSDVLMNENCISSGGEWKTTTCNQKLYQKKCKDFFNHTTEDSQITRKIYQNNYTRVGKDMFCFGISETL